jgi:hypothetical protein
MSEDRKPEQSDSSSSNVYVTLAILGYVAH